jgi:phytanoyl-CoA hydroxylase
MPLSTAQIEQYHQNGHLIVEGLLNDTEVKTLRQRIEDIAEGRVDFPAHCMEYEPGAQKEASRTTGRMAQLRKLNECYRHDPVFLEHAQRPAILDAVEQLIGPDIKIYGDQLFMKPPGGMEKTYHQDSPYFEIAPMALVTAWIALDDVTLENGCMWAVSGSHRNGPLAHSEPWQVGDRVDMRIPDTAFDRSKEQPITLKAGGCSFHHSLLLHSSGPNNTPYFRRGMATHYMTAQSRWTGAPEDKPDYPLVRGQQYADCV